jgi:membrane fusion protein (multidrug efflux system)
MKKWSVWVSVIVFLILFLDTCGREEKQIASAGNAKQTEKAGENQVNQTDPGKMNNSEKMKKNIREGKIPGERAAEFLKMRDSDAPLVQVEKVMKRNIKENLTLNGTVEPEKRVEVFSRLAAYTKKIIREEGDYVKTGEPLALLDDTEINISYQQARIQLQQSELAMREEENNFNRSLELKKTELISEQDYQTADTNYKNAKLAYENNRENFKNLELQLNYTRIKSPIEGFVTERLIEVGDRVTAGQQVYTVEDFSPLLIRVYVPTIDVVHLKKGMNAEISTDVLKGKTFVGNIKLINPRIDIQSGTVKVTLEVFDPTKTLKPGMFVEAKIAIGGNQDTLVIPKKCIYYQQNQIFVFVFQQNRVFKREITTGISEGDYIEVKKGLEADEMIVTVGLETLENGMSVKLMAERTR